MAKIQQIQRDAALPSVRAAVGTVETAPGVFVHEWARGKEFWREWARVGGAPVATRGKVQS